MPKQIGDVWVLESSEEQEASDALNAAYVEPALKGNTYAQFYLKKIWDEPWSEIKKKLKTEGSTWYVWWMDGVHRFMKLQKQEEREREGRVRG